MNILKSVLIWLCFIPVAILNGGLREHVLDRALGEKWALPVSGIVLSICIFLITWLLLPRIVRLSAKNCIITGLLWTFLTILFEFRLLVLGLVSGAETYGVIQGSEKICIMLQIFQM